MMALDALAPNPCLKNTAAGGNNLWLQVYYRVATDCWKELEAYIARKYNATFQLEDTTLAISF